MLPRRSLRAHSHIWRTYQAADIRPHCTRYSQISSVLSISFKVQYYSSTPTPSEEPPLTAKDALPLVTPSASRKKIDLHPPPRKADASAKSSPAQTPRTRPPSPTEVTSATRATHAALQDSHLAHPGTCSPYQQMSPIQLAIQDMRAAQQHGVLIPPPEDAGKIRRLYHQAKQLFKFYYNGLKLIAVHRKTVKEIYARLTAEKAAGREARLTRWETHFISTYRWDLAKLVPFVLILVILEEAIPLVVMYAPGILPSTCILPSQSERIQRKAETDRKAALLAIKESLKLPLTTNVDELPGDIAKRLCQTFGLSARGPPILARWRLRKHLAYLQRDDEMLKTEGSGFHLTSAEARSALWERGFVTDGASDDSLRPKLVTWVSSATSDSRRLSLVLERAKQVKPF